MLLGAMGHDREAVGDAIYGTKIQALVAIKDHPWGARGRAVGGGRSGGTAVASQDVHQQNG